MAEVQTSNRGGGGAGKNRKVSSIHVDMTPMVDLGFLLMTFFVLTVTMGNPNTIDMKLPAKPKVMPKDIPQIDLSNSITVILGKKGAIYYHQLDETGLTSPAQLQETNFDRDGIEKVIDNAKAHARKPDIFTVIIEPSDDSDYNDFVKMLDEMEITKTAHYGITSLKPWELKVYNLKVGNPPTAGMDDSSATSN